MTKAVPKRVADTRNAGDRFSDRLYRIKAQTPAHRSLAPARPLKAAKPTFGKTTNEAKGWRYVWRY